jgi:hypothetical protein
MPSGWRCEARCLYVTGGAIVIRYTHKKRSDIVERARNSIFA